MISTGGYNAAFTQRKISRSPTRNYFPRQRRECAVLPVNNRKEVMESNTFVYVFICVQDNRLKESCGQI